MSTFARRHIRLFMWLVVLCAVIIPLAVVGCAPRQASEGPNQGDTGEDVGEAVVVEWSIDGDCATCHLAESVDQDPTAPALYHEEEEGVACITCHAVGESELAAVHEGTTATDKMPVRLKKTKVSDESCLGSCHNTEELIAVTASSTALTDNEGLVVNPHDRPVNSSHSNISCSDCHQQHKPRAQIAQTAMALCTKCHHDKVFACGTCHD
jgi:hypothetical protein